MAVWTSTTPRRGAEGFRRPPAARAWGALLGPCPCRCWCEHSWGTPDLNPSRSNLTATIPRCLTNMLIVGSYKRPAHHLVTCSSFVLNLRGPLLSAAFWAVRQLAAAAARNGCQRAGYRGAKGQLQHAWFKVKGPRLVRHAKILARLFSSPYERPNEIYL